jgi:hypothetical protein
MITWALIPLWLVCGVLFWIGSLAKMGRPMVHKKAFWRVWTPLVILAGPLWIVLAFIPTEAYMPLIRSLREILDAEKA